ncbi:isocitrate lyase/PEP mutase family protein [Stenotrophomonas rhizophila]|uniref:isocitrate lyase/PEP mutase family protein n=1 Tax=Stenotrophomonas rhizophila TaxID=216778 RepID=UPI001E376706|nr:isocitrate lyase/phosphoenolpyruvate mutase family protein [Stenotrophomonas rhizophila]MCC7633935.1 isocitrate lyase/phosphoenolpyruvate mutase family protein [Stenotrophomonas rhizophila]MCC7663269.1 isocitrate lyase/phosphoenolpyruvate mutase family protein [Stenotrophomonas rhizophila]
MTAPCFDPRPRRAAFRALHDAGCFVLPNPWDVGSARYLHGLGFAALASTSSGVAWSQGMADGQLSLAATLDHLRALAAATPLPVNADFGDGFGTLDEVGSSVTRAIATGVAGISIEDASADPDHPLRSLDEAVARVRAARRAIDASGQDVLLVGRAENFFVGRPDLDDAITRLRAYADAGADCLYAPGISSREQIETVVAAVAPKPVNLLVGSAVPFTLADIAAMGVRRVSVGGAMARTAWGGMMRASQLLMDQGRFDGFADAASGAALNQLFR